MRIADQARNDGDWVLVCAIVEFGVASHAGVYGFYCEP